MITRIPLRHCQAWTALLLLAGLTTAADTSPFPNGTGAIEEFDNLYADLSTRNPYFERGWPMGLQSLSDGPTGMGSLKVGWKNLFEDHPDRFLFGLDLASETRWLQMPDVVAYYRTVLGELSQATAEKIACENARVLLAAPAVPGPGRPGLLLLVLAILSVALGVLALSGRRPGSARG